MENIEHINSVKAWLYDNSIPLHIVESAWKKEVAVNTTPNFLAYVKHQKTWWNLAPKALEKLLNRHHPEVLGTKAIDTTESPSEAAAE